MLVGAGLPMCINKRERMHNNYINLIYLNLKGISSVEEQARLKTLV